MLEVPPLNAPYRSALIACCEFVLARYDVSGILASGTIVRGTGDARSDLDFHVLHRQPFRERLQLWFEGVPCEIFVNPPWRIEKYFEEEASDRRPMTAHMFATGIAVYDPKSLVAALREKAQESLRHCPPIDKEALIQERYHAATALEDALDLAERDAESAALLLGDAVKRLAECRVAAEPGWRPRGKDLLETLRSVDPESALLSILATGSGPIVQRLEAARQLCLRVTGAEGFFEWASNRQEQIES